MKKMIFCSFKVLSKERLWRDSSKYILKLMHYNNTTNLLFWHFQLMRKSIFGSNNIPPVQKSWPDTIAQVQIAAFIRKSHIILIFGLSTHPFVDTSIRKRLGYLNQKMFEMWQ